MMIKAADSLMHRIKEMIRSQAQDKGENNNNNNEEQKVIEKKNICWNFMI